MTDTRPMTTRLATTRAVSTWARKAREATERRDAEIRAMRAAGASLRDIGAAAGMAHASIVRVLERAPD